MSIHPPIPGPARDYVSRAKPYEQLCIVVFRDGKAPEYIIQPSADNAYLPYLQRYINKVAEYTKLPEGEVVASLHDAIWEKNDTFPKLCFGRPVDDLDCFLIPDPFYIKSDGFLSDSEITDDQDTLWMDKKGIAYFRGSSTGGQLTLDNWRSNRRVELARLSAENPQLIDVKITAIVQEEEEGVGEEIKRAGFFSDFERIETCMQYKYLIDIDGNANSWAYYIKLAMGSVVFKVESIWEQWFYPWIKPWVHYIPIKSDMSDLIEKVEWARLNDLEVQKIAMQGKEFARAFTYKRSIEYGADVLRGAINATNSLS